MTIYDSPRDLHLVYENRSGTESVAYHLDDRADRWLPAFFRMRLDWGYRLVHVDASTPERADEIWTLWVATTLTD